MAAPVYPIQVALNCPRRPSKKTTSAIGYISIIAKILFRAKQIQNPQGISNLRLASRAVRGEPQNQWAALGAAHEKAGLIPESQIMERVGGIEPPSQPWKGRIKAIILYPLEKF